MSSTQEGTTLILASVAVCLLIYVMKQEFHGPRRYPRVAGVVGAIKGALGSRGAADCSNINPSHADWARCAQGSAMGRVPTKDASAVVKNTSLDFVSDSLKNQGLGTGRLQDDFVHDQYSSNLGVPRPGGMRIDKSSLKNNAFFSSGTQNATRLVDAGISSEGAAAFPFSRKSGDKREEYKNTNASGHVPGTEPVGMGMKLAHLKRKSRSSVAKRGGGRSASRSQVNKKIGVAPFEEQGAEFNPFSGHKESLGAGLKISEAFDAKNLGMGSGLKEAYGGLGAAVSPFSSSDVGVSPDEIAAATTTLKEVNIVQSTGGGNIDRFIRP
ncbi:unnamed protein product [Ectocarpus sp. 12 AP-2014]